MGLAVAVGVIGVIFSFIALLYLRFAPTIRLLVLQVINTNLELHYVLINFTTDPWYDPFRQLDHWCWSLHIPIAIQGYRQWIFRELAGTMLVKLIACLTVVAQGFGFSAKFLHKNVPWVHNLTEKIYSKVSGTSTKQQAVWVCFFASIIELTAAAVLCDETGNE